MAIGSNASIVVKRGPLRTAEVWFREDQAPSADIVHLYLKQPVSGSSFEEEPTMEIDLSPDPATLLANMLPATRNKIHHAERDGTKTNMWFHPDDESLRQLQVASDEFSQQKRLPAASFLRLSALQRNELLALSNAVDSQGKILVWHSYICVGDHVRLLNSVSLFRSSPTSAERNAIGRANRYLHFQDMLAFKAAGFRIYDFGGWYQGTEDADRLRINKFKEQFGGRVTTYFHCERGTSILGKSALLVKRILRKFE